MIRIGLLSDTHGYLDPRLPDLFMECDEIWHAGDIGNIDIADHLAALKTLRAVYGNIDDAYIRNTFPENQRFECEEVDVWIKHIGGYPGHYDRSVKDRLAAGPPKLFISGHSHILKVMYDKKFDLLHINPGAAGKYGLHKVPTAVRFTIDHSNIKDLEVIELGRP